MNTGARDRQRTAAMAILVLVSAGLYIRTLSHGFVFDDNTIILRNQWLTDWRYLPEIFTSTVTSFHGHKSNTYRPMLFVILSAEFHLFAAKPWGYHLFNIALHVFNTLSVFTLASFLFSGKSVGGKASILKVANGSRILPPFMAAVVFAAHPVNTEAVSWASAVTELFYTLSLLLSFLIYIRGGEGQPGGGALKYGVSLIFFILAILSKETAIVLPFLILAYDYSCYGRAFIGFYRRYIPYFVITAAYLAARTVVIGGFIHHKEVELTPYESVINVFPNITGYAQKLLFPINLNALYVFHPIDTLFTAKAVLGVIITLIAVFALYFYSRRDRAVFSGILILTLTILPVLYIPAIAAAPMAERYLYLPAVGFAVITGAFIKWALREGNRKAVLAVFVIVAALYSYGTLKRSEVWKDDFTLWSVTARSSPDSPIVHNNLGIELFYRGKTDEAVSEYKRAIELFEPYPSAHYNLGNAYFYMGMIDEALTHYVRSVELEPDNVEALHNLADIYANKGMAKEAVYYYERFIEYAPPQYEEYRESARQKIEMLKAGGR